MSKLLYNNDYLTIVGEVADVKDSATQPSRKMLHLIFTVQINGKLKNHSFHTNLEENEHSDSGYSLKNWNEWYSVRSLLTDLGYEVQDKMHQRISSLLTEKELIAK